jgi:hypothetical protein
VRCGRCGNENADTNRFCGMCGAALTSAAAPAPGAQPARAASTAQGAPQQNRVPGQATAATAQAEARPSAPRPVDDGPVITGPSFLGLNKPAPSSGRGGSLRASQDNALDHLRSSRNLDYLLEDEEEPKRGFGKMLVILVALALALGFGYLHWKQGGFDWLTASAKKPLAAQTSDNSQPPADNSAAPASTPSATTPLTTPTESATSSSSAAPAATNPATPAATSAAGNPAPTSPSASAEPGAGGSPAASSAPLASAGPAAAMAATATPAQSAAAPARPTDGGAAATSQPPAPAENRANTAETEAPPKPPSAVKPTPAKPADPVAEAEKYIYGRGVRQNCDRGLSQLKPAAEHSNPKAMISLGALYATGVCTPRDLPTAYRWFALALRKEPDNQPLQDNLQKIWSQMTQPERQLAIQLSH